MLTAYQETSRILCPSCNAAQEKLGTDNYQCAYCLTPFTVRAAENEQVRLVNDLKLWVEGALGAMHSGQGVDTGARLRMFQQDILPLLKRDVNRSLEAFSSFGNSAVVSGPLNLSTNEPHILMRARPQVLQLKTLRGRLLDGDIHSFAVGKMEKFALKELEHRLAQLFAFSNIADACSHVNDGRGYAAAARNFVDLIEKVGEMQALAGDPDQAHFVSAHAKSYEALANYCMSCERALGVRTPMAEQACEHLEAVVQGFEAAIQMLESCTFEVMQCVNLSLLLQRELAECKVLAGWLACFKNLEGVSSLTFPQFLQEIRPNCARDGGNESYHIARAEVVCDWLQALSGAKSVKAGTDYSWVEPWAKTQGKKRWLGVFGQEEKVVGIRRFLVPVWMVGIEHATTQSKMFSKDGFDSRSIVLVSACRPFHGLMAVEPATSLDWVVERVSMKGKEIILPESTAAEAEALVVRNLTHQYPNLVNARPIGKPELIYVPAVEVCFISGAIERKLLQCMRGGLSLQNGLDDTLDAAANLIERVVNQ